MYRLASLLVAASLVTSLGLAAQTKTCTAPKGYDSTPGPYAPFYLGMMAQTRMQIGEGTLRGNVFATNGVRYRLDETVNYSSLQGMGRTWTLVTLTMADTDVDKMTKTFSTNVLGNAKQVYSAKTVWPTVTGVQKSPTWGSAVKFPFSGKWPYLGKNDILFDFEFKTGTLANNGTWGGRSRAVYFLDGVLSATVAFGPGNYWPGSPSTYTCADSAHGTNPRTGAYTILSTTIYGDTYTTSSLRGQGTVSLWSYWTAPSTASNSGVIQAVTYRGSTTGTGIPGWKCQKLHVDLSTLVAIVTTKTTNASGYSGRTTFGPVKFNPAWAGQTLWGQTAWEDSSTKQVGLTIAYAEQTPPKPALYRKKTVMDINGSVFIFTSAAATTLPQFQK